MASWCTQHAMVNFINILGLGTVPLLVCVAYLTTLMGNYCTMYTYSMYHLMDWNV